MGTLIFLALWKGFQEKKKGKRIHPLIVYPVGVWRNIVTRRRCLELFHMTKKSFTHINFLYKFRERML